MNYQVLARKYRPKNFSQLKGQESLVTTVTHAIKDNKIAHAFLLTGIQGIGKTTTARIIAKTINCTDLKADLVPCGACANCLSFAQDSHPDVIEVDAASKTGINDIREIIESANYAPILATYKVYIIDEIHMLSTSAFNALLKTLEEPPSHVKFIFATTEAKKIPLTIISRCQRFDLRRLTIDELIAHMQEICQQEQVKFSLPALRLIALHSQGSVRDSLSLLDQVLLHTNEQREVSEELVQSLLGIGDIILIYQLFDLLVEAKIEQAITLVSELHQQGVEPVSIAQDLLSICNIVAKAKLLKDFAQSNLVTSDAQLELIKNLATKTDQQGLAILWQMLLKGFEEISKANNDIQALEMLLIRIGCLADLPTPQEVLSKDTPQAQPVTPAASANFMEEFKATAMLFQSHKEIILYHQLKSEIEIVSFTRGRIELKLLSNLAKDFASQIVTRLNKWTGHAWQLIIISDKQILGQSLDEYERLKELARKQEISKSEIVGDVLSAFPGAVIENITKYN